MIAYSDLYVCLSILYGGSTVLHTDHIARIFILGFRSPMSVS